MRSILTRRATWAVAPLLGAAAIAAAAPALAATTPFIGSNEPTVVSAAQGSTTTLNWTVLNTGTGALYGDPSGPMTNGTITFNAPTGTTFPAQATVPTSYSSDGTTFGSNLARLDNCTVGGGGTTLTCVIESTSSTGAPYQWPNGGYFRYSPTVAVSPTAATGTYSAAASVTTPYNTNPGTIIGQYDIPYGTLDVTITPVVAVPVVDPRIAIGLLPLGALAVLGVGWSARRRRQLAS